MKINKISEIWSKLFSKNIFELRIFNVIDNEDLLKLIWNSLNPEVSDNKIRSLLTRDLELTLKSSEDAYSTLKALSKNYTLKTIRLYTPPKQVPSTDSLNLIKLMKQERIGAEIFISWANKNHKSKKTSLIEVFYPDSIF